jgi:hypothetical protein
MLDNDFIAFIATSNVQSLSPLVHENIVGSKSRQAIPYLNDLILHDVYTNKTPYIIYK